MVISFSLYLGKPKKKKRSFLSLHLAHSEDVFMSVVIYKREKDNFLYTLRVDLHTVSREL